MCTLFFAAFSHFTTANSFSLEFVYICAPYEWVSEWVNVFSFFLLASFNSLLNFFSVTVCAFCMSASRFHIHTHTFTSLFFPIAVRSAFNKCNLSHVCSFYTPFLSLFHSLVNTYLPYISTLKIENPKNISSFVSSVCKLMLVCMCMCMCNASNTTQTIYSSLSHHMHIFQMRTKELKMHKHTNSNTAIEAATKMQKWQQHHTASDNDEDDVE